jgi:WS/DGAT/MGAT family acyltransferase
MAHRGFERLSALDASLLALEDHDAHMHIGGVALFDAGPLWKPDGGIDIDAIREFVLSRLHLVPRYRQRLAWTPLERHPIWVDDQRFNILYHVRHTSLPHGAGDRELKRLAGRIFSQALDRGKPLWEMWFVEGCGERRFAMIAKVHHCMVDGVAGMELMRHLLRPRPDPALPPREPWIALPPPRRERLLLDAALRPARAVARDAWRALRAPRAALRAASDAAAGLVASARASLRPAPPTPLNAAIGPHRRLDWLYTELELVREIRGRLGGTLNDVVLAVVTGAVRRYLEERHVRVEDLDFRVLVPVSLRPRGTAEEATGNQVSLLVARVPIDERDPRERLRRIAAATVELKTSRQAMVTPALARIAEWTWPGLVGLLARAAVASRRYNLLVTNIPGPREPAFLLGARQLQVFPAVPLFHGQSVAIGLLSYEKGLHWGFDADWDAMPDLHDLVLAVEAELEELRRTPASERAREAPARRRRGAARRGPPAAAPGH